MGFAINGAEFRVYEVKIYPPLPLYAGFLGVEGVSFIIIVFWDWWGRFFE